MSGPWVISRIAPDFDLLDEWALPAEGGPDDFGAFLEAMATVDPVESGPPLVRFLFVFRERLGALLGWDDADDTRTIPGCEEASLRDRLPQDLRARAPEAAIGGVIGDRAEVVPLYRTDDEWAAEIANATVHGVLQLAWVEGPGDTWHAQLGVYVKPRGLLGKAYLLGIQPFRHLVVYPALLRMVGQAWAARPEERSG
jgi:hypothetical protein